MAITDSAADMLGGLKSRLGFGHKDEEFYDDYDKADDDYDDGFDDYGSSYGDEPASGAYRPATARTSRSSRSTSRFGHGDSAASNLVSSDDVKEYTRVPDRLQRDPLDDSRRPSRQSFNSEPANAASSHSSRSEGYDSLFEPTETPTFTPYDPYEAYSSSTPSSYATTRPLTVIKPVVYGDVERVARAVKSGDVVVLVMRNTPDDLSKRILDFSFGVASALDANVECPGEKVFAIARGKALTEDEKTRLRNQGAL